MKSGRIDLRVELAPARLVLRLHHVSEYIVPKALVAELPIVCSKTTGKRWVQNCSHPPLCCSLQGATINLGRNDPFICQQFVADCAVTVSDLHSRDVHMRL